MAVPGNTPGRTLGGTYPTYRVDDSFCYTLPPRWNDAARLLRTLPNRGAAPQLLSPARSL